MSTLNKQLDGSYDYFGAASLAPDTVDANLVDAQIDTQRSLIEACISETPNTDYEIRIKS